MELKDFLKVKKVRCVSIGGYSFITVGKEYDVVGVDRDSVFIVNDDESEGFYSYKHFEPVLDSAENPLQKMELTPDFETEASEPKFKVGDKVYAPSVGSKIYTVKDVGDGWCYPVRIDCSYDEDHEFTKEGLITAEGLPILFLATELNHSLLSQLYGIDFEQPAKELKGSDLARAMFDKGWHLVPCVVSDVSDSDALNHDNCCLVDEWCANYFDSDGYRYKYAVPFDPRTGEPLTESVLDE